MDADSEKVMDEGRMLVIDGEWGILGTGVDGSLVSLTGLEYEFAGLLIRNGEGLLISL